eukprot:7524846-Lingulodinium_polyedra.AAC.1
MQEINLFLPANSIPLLRKLPGFEGFDPQAEVLHCNTPHTEFVDTAKAFSVKLATLTDGKCQMQTSQLDAD